MLLAVPNERLYDLVVHTARNLCELPSDEVVTAYTYFEFLLLVSAVFGIDLHSCSVGVVSELWSNGIHKGILIDEVSVLLGAIRYEINNHITGYTHWWRNS
jgi:hypothetical protein